jgi:hypothetical protein
MLEMMLAHNVYFSLKDNSASAKKRLVESCKKYLAPHEGIVFFACGLLAEELRREVNDLNFDVALHIIFRNQAAHDAYQSAPLHQTFIEENRENWKTVRVFDSLVDQLPAAD